MKFLIVGVFIVIVGFLIWRSKQNIDPKEQACAREIGELLKSNPNSEPQSIADVFEKHNIFRSQCKSVGRMVMPQLAKQGLEPDDARIAMDRVRIAYSQVPRR
ncbi:hypothetical protein C9974_04205 [Marinobacter sp. B9-2]|nr:hypothetical protein C9974_04205 [Marinobacter sp. B9-2]|tara:strand:+ start:493 stop:801 length:309 start_codon:yes stop_codon:yes gene_type:complete